MYIKNNIFCNIVIKFILDNYDIYVYVCFRGYLKL